MLRLVTIDLTDADVGLFDAYEASVLPLVPEHGGRVVARVRALDGRSETHLLFFPDQTAFEAYRDDPRRAAARSHWESSRATLTVQVVEEISTPRR